MSGVTRQEIQTLLDQTCRRLQDQLATKQEVQRSADSARDRVISYIHDYLQQNQQHFLRQLDDRMRLHKNHMLNLEARVQPLEQEVRASHNLIAQMAQKQRSIVIPSIKSKFPSTDRQEDYQQDYQLAQQEG